MSKPNPFIKQDGLQDFSVEGSYPSVSSQTGALGPQHSGPHGMCSCGSLTSWSSLQLQQQQLLGNDHSNHCSASNNAQQDMFVVVLTDSDRAAGPPGKAADAAAAGKAGFVKPYSSKHGIGTDRKESNAGSICSQDFCQQSIKELTKELCLRLIALLILVLATVGVAFRLARKDN